MTTIRESSPRLARSPTADAGARQAPIVQRPRTLPFQGGNTGSNPVGGTTSHEVPWSSWSARRPVKAEVAGSSPVGTARHVS
jgi:hypothetical protein